MRSDILDVPRFFPADIAKAIGVSDRTMSSWFGRDTVPLSEHDRDATGSGSRRLLTLRTAYVIAIGGTLAQQGLPLSFSFRNAELIFDSLVKAIETTPEKHRSESNRELLIIWPASEAETAAKPSGHTYIEIDSRISLMVASPDTDFWAVVFGNGETIATIVDCRKLFGDLEKALGI